MHQSAGAADNRMDETGHRSHPEGAETPSCIRTGSLLEGPPGMAGGAQVKAT